MFKNFITDDCTYCYFRYFVNFNSFCIQYVFDKRTKQKQYDRKSPNFKLERNFALV